MFDNAVRPNKEGIFPDVFWGTQVFRGDVALGNSTQYRICVAKIGRWFFVGVMERGAYEFDGYVHWSYAKDKLGLKHDGDARNVADFINDQIFFGGAGGDLPFERQGKYDPSLCRD